MSRRTMMSPVAMPNAHRGENSEESTPNADHAEMPSLPDGVELSQWERSLIEQALRESGGNQTKAAQRLGISRDTLRYRLKKFGL